MGAKLKPDALVDLAEGSQIDVVFRHGGVDYRHLAKRLKGLGQYMELLVSFTDQPQRKIRWSLITDLPVGESRGHLGTAWLETKP